MKRWTPALHGAPQSINSKPNCPTVSGELLKKRAAEGVRVCIMIWDDRSSINLPVLTGGSGLMITHDEETRRYFAGSKVSTAAADGSLL